VPAFWQCLNFIVAVSALCADVEPQARLYTKLRHYPLFKRVDSGGSSGSLSSPSAHPTATANLPERSENKKI
jgi:hypothetical protein